MKHFDLLDFVNKSTELGMPKPLAEYQGRRIEEAIEMATASNQENVETKNLSTQKDIKELESQIVAMRKDIKELELKIKELENSLKKEIKEVDSNLKLKIEQSKNHIIMWMGALLVTSGFITHFFK